MEIVRSTNPERAVYAVYSQGRQVGFVQSLSIEHAAGSHPRVHISMVVLDTDIIGIDQMLQPSTTTLPLGVIPATIEELVEEHRKLGV